MVSRVTGIIVTLLLCVVVVSVLRTARFGVPSRAPSPDRLRRSPALQLSHVSRAQAVQRLRDAVAIPTVSYDEPGRVDRDAFHRLHAFLEREFPTVYARLHVEYVNELSLLLEWRGAQPDRAVLLMGHLDVVPCPNDTLSDWSVDPFEPRVEPGDAHVWGRGTMDDKGQVLAILEALTALLEAGYEPQHSFFFAFGHDEEIGGHEGAARIAHVLHERGQQFEWILDEGMSIVDGVLKGLSEPVGLIGVTEKGYVEVEVCRNTAPGHASMPDPAQPQAIPDLALGITRLQAHPMPPRLTAFHELARHMAPALPVSQRWSLANLWLARPLVTWALGRVRTTNALIRTTTALTKLVAGEKVNQMPSKACLWINHRVLPGDTIADVIAHDRQVLGPEFTIRAANQLEPSPIASTDSYGFRVLQSALMETFNSVHITAPALFIANSDTRHYWSLSDNIFRHQPLWLRTEDVARYHGIDERISKENFIQMIQFYHRVIHLADIHLEAQN